jgi:outer membrane usher protein FimD/PapC
MKRYLKIFFYCAFVTLILSSCGALSFPVNSSKIQKLELGMTREEATRILGQDFQIVEKRIENGNEIEVLSYVYSHQEFFLFRFINGKLEEWNREFFPRTETIIRQN